MGRQTQLLFASAICIMIQTVYMLHTITIVYQLLLGFLSSLNLWLALLHKLVFICFLKSIIVLWFLSF